MVSVSPDVDREGEATLIALRLRKHKGVWATDIGVLSDDPFEADGKDRLGWSPFEWTAQRCDPTFTDPSEGYVLSAGDARALRQLWTIVVGQLGRDDAISRALRKFDAAYNDTTEQVLVEMWGALEALLVPRGSRRISDTAAGAVSAALARNAGERDELHALVEKSYRLARRSSTVMMSTMGR